MDCFNTLRGGPPETPTRHPEIRAAGEPTQWPSDNLLHATQAFAGIVTVSVGHCHPAVNEAINKQNALLQHTTTIYLNNQIAEYAKELTDRMPGNLKVQRRGAPRLHGPQALICLQKRALARTCTSCLRRPHPPQVVYFVNSGSEANDMAIMLARLYTGNWDMLCLRNAYHGMSIGTMGTCGQHTWKQPMPQVRLAGRAPGAWSVGAGWCRCGLRLGA